MKKLATRAVVPALAATVALTPAAADATIVSVMPAAEAATAAADAPSATSFEVATFNVLGGRHSKGRGGMRSGTSRIKGAVSFLRKHDVTLAGFQELEPKQAKALRRHTKSRWVLIGAPKRNGKGVDTRNAVGYRASHFSLVQKSHVQMRYFHGNKVNIPLVKLRAKSTGATFWMLNTHNPADVHGGAGKWRAASVRAEMKRIKRLHRQGQSVLFTGDMNEKKPFFCKVTKGGVLHSASGGSTGRPCRYPQANGIDWILGTRDIGFADWRSDESTRVRGVSDHPIVVARATVRR